MSKTTLVLIIQAYRILGGLLGILAGLALAMLVLNYGGELRVDVAWLVVFATFLTAAVAAIKHAMYLNRK
jgi:hypothetical protein